MTKKRPCKNIPLLNLELLNNFFAKNIPKTPKIELWQAPNNIYDVKQTIFCLSFLSIDRATAPGR
jgi:hypothetical protein